MFIKDNETNLSSTEGFEQNSIVLSLPGGDDEEFEGDLDDEDNEDYEDLLNDRDDLHEIELNDNDLEIDPDDDDHLPDDDLQ